MYDVAIIGCGIVGAATAYELSRYDLKIAVLEKLNDVANATTKANSAILHAGYDPEPGTLMAKLNVEGVKRAKELCEKLDVERGQVGSLVLAFSEEEMGTVRKLFRNGEENGVPGMRILNHDQVLELSLIHISKEDLKTLRHTGSYLQGHPDMKHIPGIDMSSGSLGQGVSCLLYTSRCV